MPTLSRRAFLMSSAAAASTIAISTTLSGCVASSTQTPLTQVSFIHGVASGDPRQDALIIWTRATPQNTVDRVEIMWEVARDINFTKILRSGVVQSKRNQDFTIKVDVQDLESSTEYFYRFKGASETSQIGRSLTLPSNHVEKIKFAVFSCSNYPAGYFNAYHDAAQMTDVDAVLHLGDYIYEYPMGGYATDKAVEIGRALAADNANEIITLDDYRKRYAQYRADRGLQAIHAAAPFIAVWDDHEVCNDTYKSGAENHNEGEGDFFERRAAAIQAYYEWLPIRPPYGEDKPEIYRSFDFGELLSLHMLDTRLIGRDKQLNYKDYRDTETKQMDVARFKQDLYQPERTLLGKQQFNWLSKVAKESKGKWQVLGQQVLMAKMLMPTAVFAGGEIKQAPARIAALKELKDRLEQGHSLSQEQQKMLSSIMPYNLDAWDGYPLEREAVYNLFSSQNKPIVVLAGDTHNAWHSLLKDSNNQAVGVEFGTPGVTSPGLESYLDLSDKNASEVATGLTALIAELEYCNLHQRGYMLLTFTPQEVTTEWRFVDNILTEQYTIKDTHQTTFKV